VQSLIDSGWLTFQEDKPSIENNALSGHASASTNVIMEEEGFGLVRKVDKIKGSMEDVFTALCQVGLLKVEYQQEGTCSFHPGAQHAINECSEFKELLQDLIDWHILQVCHKNKEAEVCTLTGEEPCLAEPKPLVIHFTKTSFVPSGRQPIVIQAPSPFLYESEKAVPWRYGTNMLRSEQEQR